MIEVLVATAVMTVATVSLAQVSLQAVRANYDARSMTTATVLASQKMEQLRALAWSIDASGIPVSDTSTDTAVTPEQPSGGTGLRPSPPGALAGNLAGYCDFVDADGRTLGGGTDPSPGTAFIRRWSIHLVPLGANEALVIQVSVIPIGRPYYETRILGIKSRKVG